MKPVLVSLAVIASLLLSIGGGSALAQVPSDLEAVVGPQSNGFAAAGVDRVSGTTTFTGTRSWVFSLNNRSGSPVTSPTVSVDSGYAPTLFCSVTSGGCPIPLSSFPIAFTGPSLPSGQGWTLGLQSGVATTFTPGFDSARTMTPLVIPVGGAQQKVTVTVRASDPNVEGFEVFIYPPLAGVSFVAVTGPANLDQGESFGWELSPGGTAGAATLGSIHTGKTYVFSVVFDVPNPFGVAFTYRPYVDVSGGVGGGQTCSSCAGTSVTVTEPTLDGTAPGRGTATFSVAETGHLWDAFRQTEYFVHYQPQVPSEAEPFSKDQCKNDGWESFGQPAFKNQGDCVSYVATHGRNPPNG